MTTETMYRTQTPLGEPMQARDLTFLRLNMERHMRQQGLDRHDWVNWFNPPTREVTIRYEGRRTVSETMSDEFPLWLDEVRF